MIIILGCWMDLYKTLRILGHKGSMPILEEIHKRGRARFSTLSEVVSSDVELMRKLNKLMELGLVERHVLNESRRPTEYTLTEKGRKVSDVLARIKEID